MLVATARARAEDLLALLNAPPAGAYAETVHLMSLIAAAHDNSALQTPEYSAGFWADVRRRAASLTDDLQALAARASRDQREHANDDPAGLFGKLRDLVGATVELGASLRPFLDPSEDVMQLTAPGTSNDRLVGLISAVRGSLRDYEAAATQLRSWADAWAALAPAEDAHTVALEAGDEAGDNETGNG